MAQDTTKGAGREGTLAWPSRLAAAVADIGRMPTAAATTERMTVGQLRLQLFMTSFVILFFELACIRWVPANVRLLSYFMNFILLAAGTCHSSSIQSIRLRHAQPAPAMCCSSAI